MKRILLAGAKRGKRLLALALTAAMLLTPFPALAPTTALAEEPAPAQRTIFANIGPGGFNAANTSRGLLDPNKTMFINGTKGTAGVLNADGTVGLTMATADAIAGSAFLSRRIYSETGFSARFEMRLGARGTDASDGWAFVVAKDTNKIGGTANSIGYEGIKNSFAFIYDTFYNRDRTEKVGTNNTNYVPQVQKATGGTYDYATAENLTASGSYGSVLAFPGKGLGGAANYSVFGWVDYDNKAGTMALYISLAPGEGEELTKPDEPISVFEGIDIEAVLGNQYYIGFTAASGRQQHILRQFYVFNESAPEVDFNGDGVGMNMSGGGEGGGGGEESAIIEDYTPPTAPVITQSESGMTDSLMVFSVGGSEDLNGVRKYQYRIGGETAWHDYAAGGEFVLDGSLPVTAAIAPGGEVTVSVRALDGGGNISDETSATLRYTIAPGPALTSPAIGAVNVFPANTLELGLSFKSKINVLTPGTVTVTASDGTTAQFAGGAVAAGDSRWDASQSKLTLPFALGDAGLGYGKNYTVTVSGFVNTSNIRMGDNDTPATESFTFSTIGREATPAASINFTNERLSGFSNNVIYRINGTEYTAASGAIPLQAAWLGTNIQIVKPGTAATVDSAAQTLTIPARRAAPIGLGSAVGPSKITGTTTDMEYAASASATSWITCAAPDTAVGEGTYYVRYKVTASGFKSEATTAEVMATTYTLNLTAPSFAAIAYGGGQPAAQALTITSSGNSNAAITNVSSTSGDFMISAGSAAVAAGGVNTSYTLQPAAGLGVGVHTATITVAYNGRTATTQVSMTVREATPVIGIDYVNEQLTNLTQGAVYTVNGTVYTASTGRLNIENAWLGTDISIIKTNANTALSSDILPLTVLPRSAPPTGLAATGEVYAGDNGALSGVLSTMEYRRPGAAWISGTDSGDIANLAPAEYQVRYKAKAVADATFSSRATALTITASRNYKLTAAVSADPAGQEGKVTTGYLLVTFEHANGVNAGVPVAGLPIAGSSADPGVYVSGDASAGTVGDDGDTDDKTWRVNIYPTMAGGAGTATLTFNPWTAANGNTYTVTPNPASVTVYKVVTEVTPTASVNYADERLDGLDAGATYKINGAARTADGAGHIPLGEFIPKAGDADQSRSLIIVKAGTDTSVDSPAQEAIAIPRRPATPEVNVTRQPSSETAPNDTGAITIGDFAPSAAYEYGPLNTSTGTVGPGGWSDFPSATPSGITDLTPDIYYARVKATGTSFASDSRSFQIYGFDTIDFGGVYVGYAVSDNPTDTRGANKAVTQRVRVEAGETITAAQWVDYSDPTFPVLLFPPEIDDLPFTLAGSGADWTVRPRNGLADAENPYEAWLMVTYGVASDTVVNRVSLQVHPRAEIVSVTQSGTDAKGATNEIKVTFVRPIDLAYTDVTVDGAAVKTIGETDFADVSSDKTVYKIAVTPLMDHKTNDDINVRINIDGDDLRPTYYFQNSNGEHGVAGSASVAIPRAILSAEAVTPIPGYSTGYIQFTLDRDLCPIDTAAIEEALGSVEIKVGGTLLPPGQIFRIDADMGYTFRLRITPTMSGNVTLAIPGFGITGTFAVDGSVSATGRELTDNAFFLSENGSNYLTGGADARQTLNPVNAYDGRTPAYAAPAMELRVNREFGDWTVSEFYIDGEAYSGYSTAGGGPLDQIFDGAANDPSYPNLTNYLKITLPAGWTSENGTRAIHAVLTKGDENVLLFAKTEITGITPRYALTVTGGTGGGLYPAGTIAPIQGVLPVWNAEFLGWTQAAESGDAGYIAALPAEISGAVVMPAGDAALTAQYTRPAPSPNGGTGSGGGGAAVPPPPAQPPATPQRTVSQADISYISGADRVATAVAVSRTGWSQSAAVVIAPGAQANLIDALAADPYAGQLGAPVLLGMGETPDPAVIAEIQRLGAGSVVVVGALGDAYVAALQAALPGVKIEILRGGNRLETALLLAGKIENPRGAIVVGYDALADAVSVASWAAAHSYLIIPAGVDGSFTPPANLPAPEGGENYIIGGPTLVRDIPGYTRIYGADRYATNLLIRQTLDFELDLVYTANGVTVVDALTGAPLAAKTNSPIVLLRDGDLAGADFGPITAETKVFAFGFGG